MDTILTARGLLLDMDSTLVNSEAAVERCWRRWAAEHELEAEKVLGLIHGRQGWAAMAELLPDRPMELNLADNARMLAEETTNVEGVVPVPGAPVFMSAIAGFPHALVTSAPVALTGVRMGAAGLALPPICITAESVTASKPDPEGFLKGAAELGLDPENCLVFEDSEAGIVAAKAAGMRVVGVGDRAATYLPTAHVRDLTQIRAEVHPDGVIAVHVLPA